MAQDPWRDSLPRRGIDGAKQELGVRSGWSLESIESSLLNAARVKTVTRM